MRMAAFLKAIEQFKLTDKGSSFDQQSTTKSRNFIIDFWVMNFLVNDWSRRKPKVKQFSTKFANKT